MPLEYYLPLMDTADVVEDLDFVAAYRQFVVDRTGVEMMIEIWGKIFWYLLRNQKRDILSLV